MALTFTDLRQHLEEKALILGNNKPYGQVLFLAGGAGSGKGFALSNLIHLGRGGYKVFDPDEFKNMYLKYQDLRAKKFFAYDKEIMRMCNPDGKPTPEKPCMKDPKVTEIMHKKMAALGWEDRMIDQLLSVNKAPDLLPNIVFDRTMRDTQYLTSMIYKLQQYGYEAKNIHIVWVLTNDQIALKRNVGRERTVPPTILAATHAGAAKSITKMAMGFAPPKTLMDGEVWIVTGQADKVSSGKGGSYIIKPDSSPSALKFIRLKRSGSPFESSEKLWNAIGCDVCNNTPLREDPICIETPPKCN